MLTAKFVKIHGIKDERWTTKDKVQQYRGILRLYAREKKLQIASKTKFKKSISRELRSLSKDVKEYRSIISNVKTGNKSQLCNLLFSHKDLLLASINSSPAQMFTTIFQDISLKRKQLDKILFRKKLKMKQFLDFKLESNILLEKIEKENIDLVDREKQCLITRYQRSMARQNAAHSIQITYELMLKILRKDAIYFDAVLEALRKDQKDQCDVIYKMTVIGQLTCENLDDNRLKYKHLAREVLINMKERERSLKIARAQVKDISTFIQSLVRVQSDADMAEKIKETAKIDGELESQIQIMEEIFDQVKESLKVRSLEDLHLRLEEQVIRKEKLSKQYEQFVKERDLFLKKKQHAETVLANFKYSMISTTGQYKEEKKRMLKEIEERKKQRNNCKEIKKTRGELLLKIKVALQNMADMLILIEDKSDKKVAKSSQIIIKESKEVDRVEKSIVELQKVENDALALLAQVTRKVNQLASMSNFELDQDREEKARDLYQTYVADHKSKLKFCNEEEEDTGIFVEHEIIDGDVFSRKDIKKQSKKIVDAHLKDE